MSIFRQVARLVSTATLALALTAGAAVTTAAPAHANSMPPIGSVLCHSSATAGWQCGTLTAVNLTITYPGGTVHNAFRYNACSGPHDQGAPIYHNNAQVGTIIGGSGSCSWGGVTYGLPS